MRYEKKYEVGDLVEIIKSTPGGDQRPDNVGGRRGIILYGSPVSLYVEDRPIRSISTFHYSVMVNGIRKTVYEEEISRKIS